MEKIEKEKNGKTPVIKEAGKGTYNEDTKLKILPAIDETSIEIDKRNQLNRNVLWESKYVCMDLFQLLTLEPNFNILVVRLESHQMWHMKPMCLY